MLRGDHIAELLELQAKGLSIREISRQTGLSRNTVSKALKRRELFRHKPRPPMESTLEEYKPYILQQIELGVTNCERLLREITVQGTGGHSTLRDFVKPFLRPRICWAPPGVGKTHIAVALGLEAIEQGLGVYFVTAQALIEDLRQAHAENRLERRMRVYLAPKALIVDEVGYLPFDTLGATMLFRLVSARCERGSVILTSNNGFAQWGEVFPDPIIATAILDRLLHHAHIVNIRGDSYRLKDKRRAGFMSSPFGQKDRPTQ